jgi:hypothetical protein
MSHLHQDGRPLFALFSGQARRLRLHQAHQLRLRSGRLWLTVDGRLGAPAEDVLLQAGDAWTVPGQRAVVVEALPMPGGAEARFDLLLQPEAV